MSDDSPAGSPRSAPKLSPPGNAEPGRHRPSPTCETDSRGPYRLHGLLWPAVATVIGLAILVGLGLWQLERRAWKTELLARIDARIHAAPTPLPPEAQWAQWTAAADEYRHVAATGRYRFDKQVLVRGNSPRERGTVVAGFAVITPLELASGATVLVNRGFIAEEMRDALVPLDRRTDPAAAITGLMRASQARTSFTPADDPGRGEWFTRDITAIAAAEKLARTAPFIIDADAKPGQIEGPRGGLTVVNFPNDHLQYALTWFGLAAALAGVFVVFAVRRMRGDRG
ncbi:SURF1 family protein [Chelatococcus reniformis]|uniref:SURF1-like protein n=1 Tax=Chelatococcus reniformis TaxID=1494448 RepID=A0A916U6U4_9HYPH|nr:SURF1 family protein [Chelatococcus reniformis]GGC62900.1 hypothetical protein GCM10010994_21890 [Chelatococcus reniformis]